MADAPKKDSLPPVEERLQRLSAKAKEWYELALTEKLKYLELAKDAIKSPEGLALMEESSVASAQGLRKAEGEERDFYCAWDNLTSLIPSLGIIDAYIEALRVQLGTSECASDLTNLETRVVGSDGTESKGTEDGVVVAKVFPLLPQERNGPNKTAVAEVYLNPNHVSSAQEVKPWNFKALQCDKPGVCVVLGAGNYVNLTVTDVLHQLYHQNQVVFVKHHPIRGALDPWLRFIFQSLFDHGYLDSELDVDTARSQSIVYSPLVQGVHMTGGKLTHDRLVWGTTLAEQAKRRKEQTPKLTAHMTSELGAVTPHIVTPVHYTDKELDFQAQVLVSAKWINGGASCNSPQVVVFSDEWPQQRQFLDRVEHHWKKLECPIAYYPGTTDRVQAFENHYGTNDATQQSSSSTASVTTARWMGKLPPNSHDMHMPLYTIHMSNVDVSTPDALEAAKKEYAFANEAFGPVLVFATLKTTSTSKGNHDTATDESVHVDRFMDQAVDFCNKALFGTLSCSVVVPDWAQQKPYLERTLAKLQYGGVALNAWGAVCYGPKFGTWGGYMPAEELENVQSGIGHVHNVLFLPHVDKTVMRYRIVDETANFTLTKPRATMTRLFNATPKFILDPSLKNFLGILAALLGPVVTFWIPTAVAALAAAWVGYMQIKK